MKKKAPNNKKLWVYILTIQNEYGDDVYVRKSFKGAYNALLDYVKCRWDSVFDCPLPKKKDLMVDQLFDTPRTGESYNIDKIEVLD